MMVADCATMIARLRQAVNRGVLGGACQFLGEFPKIACLESKIFAKHPAGQILAFFWPFALQRRETLDSVATKLTYTRFRNSRSEGGGWELQGATYL